MGAKETVEAMVVGDGVGLGETVGLEVPEGTMVTSAQLKNCSGHVVPLKPVIG